MQELLDLNNYIKYIDKENILLVCDKSFYNTKLYKDIKKINKKIICFDDFNPNPTYESVRKGVEIFKKNKCEYIIAIGGGSSMEVAKCIKLYSNMDDTKNYLDQEIVLNDVKLLAIPTTAGTGSEATKYAVIYYNNEKKSIEHESIIPNYVLFIPQLLKTLPLYQKKSTVLDALSHSIESIWSINSNEESINYSIEAIKIIKENLKDYLDNNEDTFMKMLKASNYAGKAINITKTTAGHALCYKLTSLYNISHGHSAMLVNSILFPYMLNHMEKCIDKRGIEYLKKRFDMIIDLFNNENYFKELLKSLDLYNIDINYNDIDLLVNSVNIERLSNNPIKLEKEDIKTLYLSLFSEVKKCK